MDIYDHVSDMSQTMKNSRAIVSMGSYNSFSEAISLAKPLLDFPRPGYHEQEFYVRTYSKYGLLISDEKADKPEKTAKLMQQLIYFKPTFMPNYNGAKQTQDIIQELI